MANGVKIDLEHLKPVPVGKSDWEGFCQTNYTVDKTLLIKELIDESVSYFDSSEAFFHGMTLGFLAVLRNRYKVRSNRESGEGRFDIALTPLVENFPGVIIVFVWNLRF